MSLCLVPREWVGVVGGGIILRMCMCSTVCGGEGGEGWRLSGPSAPGSQCSVVF